MNKRIYSGILLCMLALGSYGQSGTNSPYSQYGIGVLSDPSQGFNRGMNGVGLALRRGDVVNTLNPASYSAVDSLTMLFDVGLSGQLANFKENGASVNAKNADFDYAVGHFRLHRGLGMSFGLLPLSSVGYNYSTSNYLNRTDGSVTSTYKGEGGLRQAFVGVGARVLPQLSVGLNAAYLWGSIDRQVITSNTTYINSLQKYYSASVSSYKLDFGLQWTQRLTATDQLTVGATVGVGHKFGDDADCLIVNARTTGTRDTTTLTVSDALQLPMTYGLGLAWTHGSQLLIAADVSLQQWGSLDFPVSSDNTYELRSGVLKDRWKAGVGADYVPHSMSQHYLQRVHYRVGAGFSTPYYYINGQDGPKELSASIGFGLPLQNRYNNRSVLNVSAQWVRTSASSFITENTFRLNIGLTFNERWFSKWKVE